MNRRERAALRANSQELRWVCAEVRQRIRAGTATRYDQAAIETLSERIHRNPGPGARRALRDAARVTVKLRAHLRRAGL